MALPGLPDDDALRVLAAIPATHRRAASTARWLTAVQNHPAVTELRADRRARLMALCWALARYTDRRSMTTRPGHALLLELTCLQRRTLLRLLALLRTHQLLAHAESGSTPQYRRGDDDAGNRAAVYVLITSRPSARPNPIDTPTDFPSESSSGLSARKESSSPSAALRAAGGSGPGTPWPASEPTHRSTQRLAAAQALQQASPVCRRISTLHLRSLCRTFFQSGYTVRDLLHALDYSPCGAAHPYAYDAADLRNPGGWLFHRLSFWLDPNRYPLPSPRQQRDLTPTPPADSPSENVPATDATRRRYLEQLKTLLPVRVRAHIAHLRPAASGSGSVTASALPALEHDRSIRAAARAARIDREISSLTARSSTQDIQPLKPNPHDVEQTRAAAIRRARTERADRARAVNGSPQTDRSRQRYRDITAAEQVREANQP